MHFIPTLNKNTAINALASKENFLQRKKMICRSELLYLPYYVYSCEITLQDCSVIRSFLGVDTVDGECAYFRTISNVEDNKSFSEGSYFVSEDEAKQRAQKFIMNEILYKKKKFLNFKSINIELQNIFRYPYWIGYYKKRRGIDFNIIDAVTGQKQGPKMKGIFIKLLMH